MAGIADFKDTVSLAHSLQLSLSGSNGVEQEKQQPGLGQVALGGVGRTAGGLVGAVGTVPELVMQLGYCLLPWVAKCCPSQEVEQSGVGKLAGARDSRGWCGAGRLTAHCSGGCGAWLSRNGDADLQ